MKKDKFKIICKKCGEEADIKLKDDGACGDPDCCGSPSYSILIECNNCKEREIIYD